MTNEVDYFEIGSPDPAGAQAFYSGVFDWKFGELSVPAGYAMVNGDKGGLWDSTTVGGGSWAIFYVHVDDVAATIARAESLGATVAMPLINNGRITFAHLIDPRGNRFAVWRPNEE